MVSLIRRTDLAAAIEKGDVTVVDALPASYYEQQHLPDALNLVEDDVAVRAESLLPDKAARIVTYCSNARCGNSGAVAHQLEKLGYQHVQKYAEGIQDWTEAGFPVEHGPSSPSTSTEATAGRLPERS